jgi:hypothetical protein
VLERDWQDFLSRGTKAIKIAHVREECVNFLGADSDILHLAPEYARKAAGKHGLSPAHFNLIFDAVGPQGGLAVSCRQKHVSFLYETGRWYHVCVKVSGDTRRLYLATFHRIDATGVNSRLKKVVLITK